MNGAAHYAEAEKLLEQAQEAGSPAELTALLAEAGVHAQLAQAAATLEAPIGHTSLAVQRWRSVLQWDKVVGYRG